MWRRKWVFQLCTFTFVLFLLHDSVFLYYMQTENAHGFDNDDTDESPRNAHDSSLFSDTGIIYPESSSKLLLTVTEQFALTRPLHGALFKTTARVPSQRGASVWLNVTTSVDKLFAGRHLITTSLLHSFSPSTEKHAKEMFPEVSNQNVFYANSPALYWDSGSGRLVVVMRIWLGRERYRINNLTWPKNRFQDNYLYAQTFDRKMRPLDPGHIIGIPAIVGGNVGDGPLEPRLFSAFNRSNLFLSFNSGNHDKFKQFTDYTFIWDYNKNQMHVPNIVGPNPVLNDRIRGPRRDKHWIAFNMAPSGTSSLQLVHFVHSFDPMRILKCNQSFSGHITFQAGSFAENIFNRKRHHLRGGTPFVLYKWPYYISVAHATLSKDAGRYYTANLVVLRADAKAIPPFRIVYISYPIHLDEQLLRSFPIVRSAFIADPFIFPVGLIVENKDSAIVGAHVSDHSALLFRIRGIEKLMNDIITMDLDNAKPIQKDVPKDDISDLVDVGHRYKELKIGPNAFVRFAATKESNVQFINGDDADPQYSTLFKTLLP